MKEHSIMQFVMVVGSTWVNLSIGGMSDGSLEEWLELSSGVAALLKMVDEHVSSGCFVLIITAKSIDAEDHSMDDTGKQPWWVA